MTVVSRRRWVFGAALAAALSGCVSARPQGSAISRAASIEIASGVYMVPGEHGEPDLGNLGRVGNAGFIVGDSGVVAIDTGTSYLHGQALLTEIARVTDRPVRLALVTHTRQEFLFGAAAFRERGIPVHMHRRAAALMAARCEGCLKTLKRTLGDEAMRGTLMFKPDVEFDASHTLALIGRPLRVLEFGHSSGPGDTAVLDERSGTLFAGGLADQERIPDVQDSDLVGWARALDALDRLPLRHVVPGHGPATDARVLGTTARYLAQLQARTGELLAHGTALSDVADMTVLPEFADWDQVDTIHRRNASVVFLRLERERMFRP